MKFMGSKKWMLGNGLGVLLDEVAKSSSRFLDLFCGSAAVSTFVARRQKLPVLAFDLQAFSVTLAAAVVERDVALDWQALCTAWTREAESKVDFDAIPSLNRISKSSVRDARNWCGDQLGVVTRAYGGHYFSPLQAQWIDAFLSTVPKEPSSAAVARAALIASASRCAASPGHTAQPFQPTKTAKSFLQNAWDRDVCEMVELGLQEICGQFALKKGRGMVLDAACAAEQAEFGDLVFIDPPYSGVHYSRFYHVLETISRGECGEVSGSGRYPDADKRPRSLFSMKSTATEALGTLLESLSARRASVVLTFPNHLCSNGLSGTAIRAIAKKLFRVDEKVVSSRFSTLGGPRRNAKNEGKRFARRDARELILYMRPSQRRGSARVHAPVDFARI